jgi:predicted MPP superfamily phosphohydrolase
MMANSGGQRNRIGRKVVPMLAFFDDIAGQVPLELARHTHGGQVRLPLVPVFWLPRARGMQRSHKRLVAQS